MDLKNKMFAATLSASLLGYAVGSVHEAYERNAYKILMKSQVAWSAVNGYSFREGVDHRFYDYNTILHKDPESMTMVGLDVKNGVPVGPRWSNGEVGFPIKDKFVLELKKKWGNLLRLVEDSYNSFKGSSAGRSLEEIYEQMKEIK